ncbi:1,5-anhydro-D-fructose reductase-like [Scylla paramamosain]|uniref:1,5-anhydro-D-fructose reductase-like n=1 Tax=Scylla paramamosain TaxID=85552 RepID=UPI00308370E5
MAFILAPTDDCTLPMIGISIKEDHEEWKEQLDCMLHRGDVYVEVPISGYLSEAAIKRIGEHARMKGLKREDFIISTSITVPEDAGAAVALVKEFVDHFCTHIDLLYLENPVGLKGTDPMTIYNTAPAGTHPKIRKVTDMFKRMREGYLKVTPRIMENLRMLWRVLEVELVSTGAVHNLGLRHFSQEQVEKLLKGGVRHRPLALQAEVNPYREQRDLRCWCQEANIPLVGIHPYGSPLHVPSKDMPFLWKHPKVIKIAERVGVGPKVILSRHILQSRLRMVYDNTELFLPSFMTENIWRFQLTHGQMNKLGKLSKLPHKHPLGKYELLRVIDPSWPFSFPEETVKGGIRGEGTEANYKGDEEAEHKNIDEIKQAEDSGMMINKELKEERHEKKKIPKVAEREIEMIEVYREEITTEREGEESTGKEEETEVEKGNTGEEVDEEEMEKEEEERSERVKYILSVGGWGLAADTAIRRLRPD